ncbi:MAG: hypothetical protein IJL76_02340 [Bacilli bacterium]|nr:hypothetical protein [Bacilli bacterium]
MDKISKLIEIDKTHITEFPMEAESGTKKVMEQYHQKAVNDRNDYCIKQIKVFTQYRNSVLSIMKDKAKALMPADKTKDYETDKEQVSSLYDAVIKSNKYLDDAFKLGFSNIIEKIEDGISLNVLNDCLKECIAKFSAMGINLTLEDFNYTMFTKKYMDEYFKAVKTNDEDFSNSMRRAFDSIYWECPNLSYQLRLNLLDLLDKYKKEINAYLTNDTTRLLHSFECDENTIVNKYIEERTKLGRAKACDPYYNLSKFMDGTRIIDDYLEGSEVREKNYNTYCNGNYNELSDSDKTKFNDACRDLYTTLVLLKKYYRYMPIVTDLLKKYAEKDKDITEAKANDKELDTSNKNRIKIYNSYLKANGVGFLAKYNPTDIKTNKVKINDEVKKYSELYNKKTAYDISINLDKFINESSSMYDLFMTAASSFDYLVKQLKTICSKEEDNEFDLDKEIGLFFRFIFNPSNEFLRKLPCFSQTKIEDIISEKYKLLGLNINSTDISKAQLDDTMSTISYINVIQNISTSDLSLEDMNFIVKADTIEPIKVEEEEEVETI